MADFAIRRLLTPSDIRAILDTARELEGAGARILHLELGRPEWKTFGAAVQHTKKALDDGWGNYMTNRGLPSLRDLLAVEIRRLTGRGFDPETELIVTLGGCPAFQCPRPQGAFYLFPRIRYRGMTGQEFCLPRSTAAHNVPARRDGTPRMTSHRALEAGMPRPGIGHGIVASGRN